MPRRSPAVDGGIARRALVACAALLATIVGLAVTATSAPVHTGDRDPSFGDNGRVFTQLADGRHPDDAAIDQEGRIVVVGQGDASRCKGPPPLWVCHGPEVVVARYLADGSPDPFFGNEGRESLPGSSIRGGGWDMVATQPAGRILLAHSPFVQRLNPEGSLDPTFGSHGRAMLLSRERTDFFPDLYGLDVLPDGGIILGGESSAQTGREVLLLNRLDGDGRLDRGYGLGGRVRTLLPGCSPGEPVAMAADSAGGIVIGAYWRSPCGPGHLMFEMVKYLPDGTLDPGFGTGGKVIQRASEDPRSCEDLSVATMPDGGVVALTSLGLERFLPDGTPIRSFGHGGRIKDPGCRSSVSLGGPVVDRAGRILTFGTVEVGGRFCCSVKLIMFRFLPSGALDRTFGVGGDVLTAMGGGTDLLPTALLVDADDRLVAVAQPDENKGNIGLARYFSG